MKTYDIEMVGGPIDGASLKWQWLNDDSGREGEQNGLIIFEGVVYQCNEDKTRACFVRGRASQALLREFCNG